MQCKTYATHPPPHPWCQVVWANVTTARIKQFFMRDWEASYVNLLLNFTLYAYSLAPTLTWICPRGVELQTSPTLTGSAHSAVTICIKYSLLSTVNTHTSLLTQSRSARVTPCEPLRVYSDIERSRLQLQWPTLYMIWILDKAKTAGGGVLYQMNLVLPKKNTSYLQNLWHITCYFMIWHVAYIAHLVTGIHIACLWHFDQLCEVFLYQRYHLHRR